MTAYCALSDRAHKEVALLWQKVTGYELVLFDSMDIEGCRLHHTTHLLFIGSGYAMVSTDLIAERDRTRVLDKLRSEGLDLVEMNQQQVYATHSREIRNREGHPVLIMPSTGFNSLTKEQLAQLRRHVADIKHIDYATLEDLGGGSVGSVINDLF